MATRNLYLVLGVPPSASASEIHDAYRRMAKERHPDLAGAGSTAAFQDLAQAYAVLSNPRRRRRHDAALARAGEPQRATRLERHVGGGLGNGLDELLAALGVGIAGPSRACASRGAPLYLEVELTGAHARRGCRVELPLTLRLPCSACGGSEAAWAAGCLVCGGVGAVAVTRVERFDIPPGTLDGTWLEYRIDPGTADHALDVDQQDHVLLRLRVRVRT